MSAFLQVVIGLMLVYFVLSLVCSGLNEWLAGILGPRGKFLELGVRNLIGRDVAAELFTHPLISTLGRQRDVRGCRARPSYIPSPTFALALLDLITPGALALDRKKTGAALASVTEQIGHLHNGELQKTLMVLLEQAEGDLDEFRKSVARWFDDAMERVTGWYRRRTHLLLFVWAVVVASAANVDSVVAANALWHDANLRAAVNAEAQRVVAQPTPTPTATTPPGAVKAIQDLENLKLPIGWSLSTRVDDPRRLPRDIQGWLVKVVGLLFTAVALSLGAPFWFQLLNRFVNLRLGGPPPPKEAAPGAKEEAWT